MYFYKILYLMNKLSFVIILVSNYVFAVQGIDLNNPNQYFAQSLELDSGLITFTVNSTQTTTNQTTVYGNADITTLTCTSGSISRETKIYELNDFEDTFLIQHTYSSATTFDLVAEFPFKLTRANALNYRMYYGPADDTVYMDEDYMNIPAVNDYDKIGDMSKGGVPLNYVWDNANGVALGVLTQSADTYLVPLAVNLNTIHMGVEYYPESDFNQPSTFGNGTDYVSQMVFLSGNSGDFYQPLSIYTKLLEIISNKTIQNVSIDEKFRQPYWKTWGLDATANGIFTKTQVRQKVIELQSIGINWIMFDWGWFYTEGNWEVNEDVFDDEDDLVDFVQELKTDGMVVGIWYQPLQVDGSDAYVAANLLQYAIKNQNNSYYIDDDDLNILNPSYPAVQTEVMNQFTRFKNMGIEHIYIDSQIVQLALPPDYSQGDPLNAFHALEGLYETMFAFGQTHNIAIEICPDGRSQSILNFPQSLTNIGDPKDDRQLRSEFKSLKAILGDNAIIGTYVDPFEDNQVSGSFLNLIGIGGQLMSLFSSLADLGLTTWQMWTQFYYNHDLIDGQYQDFYDIGFDYPEAHVVQKGSKLYYSFFTQEHSIKVRLSTSGDTPVEVEAGKPITYNGNITFKGLAANNSYQATSFPAGTQYTLLTNASGEAAINTIAFNKEILFILESTDLIFANGFE